MKTAGRYRYCCVASYPVLGRVSGCSHPGGSSDEDSCLQVALQLCCEMCQSFSCFSHFGFQKVMQSSSCSWSALGVSSAGKSGPGGFSSCHPLLRRPSRRVVSFISRAGSRKMSLRMIAGLDRSDFTGVTVGRGRGSCFCGISFVLCLSPCRECKRTQGVSTTDLVGRMLLMTKAHHSNIVSHRALGGSLESRAYVGSCLPLLQNGSGAPGPGSHIHGGLASWLWAKHSLYLLKPLLKPA